ncbi:MAG: hypothetical protein ACREJO_02430 [Phycisphaerales bacterium]
MSHNHPHPHEHAHTTEQHDAPDAWHTHYSDETLPQHAHGENIASGQVFAFGAAGFIILVAVIGAVVVYYNWYLTSLEEKLVEQAPFATDAFGGAMNATAEAARAKMPSNDKSQFEKIDGAKGTYQVTLDKAIEMTVSKYQQAK